jgi:hypothetical protein
VRIVGAMRHGASVLTPVFDGLPTRLNALKAYGADHALGF